MKKMKKGFTIVELVIVIGVIAILSAVLIPTFTSLSNKAKEATAKQEVADVYTAYLVDAEIAEEETKSQAEVIIAHTNGEQYVYTAGSGWEKESPKTTLTGKEILFDNGNNNGAADAGEIVVYAK